MTDRKGFPGFIRSVSRKTVRALYKRAGYFCLFLRAHRFHPFLGLSLRRSFRRRPEVALKRMECLDRGLVAMRTGDGIFISWRMISLSPPMRWSTRVSRNRTSSLVVYPRRRSRIKVSRTGRSFDRIINYIW